jgi:hypothetical protein
MWHRERQGTAGHWQAVGPQPAAELGQEPVRAGRSAGLVYQPSEERRQIHAAIMPPRPWPVIRAAAMAQPGPPVYPRGKAPTPAPVHPPPQTGLAPQP